MFDKIKEVKSLFFMKIIKNKIEAYTKKRAPVPCSIDTKTVRIKIEEINEKKTIKLIQFFLNIIFEIKNTTIKIKTEITLFTNSNVMGVTLT